MRRTTPQTTQVVQVTITDVDLPSLIVHCRDKIQGDLLVNMRELANGTPIPVVGEIWSVERIGYQWHLRDRLVDTDDHDTIKGLSQGDVLVKATGAAHVIAPDGLILNGVDILSLILPVGGEIVYHGTTEPTSGNWKFPNGQLLDRVIYAEFFAQVGTRYGVGDGSTTFAMPEKRGLVDVMLGGGVGGVLGATGGEATHVLSIAEMPAHAHPGSSATTGTVAVPTASPTANAAAAGAGALSVGLSIASQGGGGAHNNLQPYMLTGKLVRVR